MFIVGLPARCRFEASGADGVPSVAVVDATGAAWRSAGLWVAGRTGLLGTGRALTAEVNG